MLLYPELKIFVGFICERPVSLLLFMSFPFSAQIIFRFALSLFKYKEEEFLKLQDSTTLFKYLRYFTRTILDSRYRNVPVRFAVDRLYRIVHIKYSGHPKTLLFFFFFFFLSRKLMNIAFMDMNPFPMRQIQNRRAFHLEKVRLELTELEAIRQTFLRERETSRDRQSFASDDEEDN